MAAGAVRLPELRQDIKINTSDLTRARRAAQAFKTAMERDLDVNTDRATASLDKLVKKLDDMKKQTKGLREELTALKDEAARVDIEVTLDRESVRRAMEQLRQATTDQTVNVKVDIDDDSLEAAKAKLKAALNDETVDVKVNVDSSQIQQALSAIQGLRSAMGESFNVDTSSWTREMSEVRNTLQAIKRDTDQLYESAVLLGAAFKASRRAAEELKDELIQLQAVAAKDIKVDVDIDDDSLTRAKALIDAAFGDQTVNIKVDIDKSALDQAAASASALSAAINSAMNVDTDDWTQRMNGVRDTLAALQTRTDELYEGAIRLGAAFSAARRQAQTLKEEIIELQAVAAKNIKISVDLDDDSVAEVKAILDTIFHNEKVTLKVDVDMDSVDTARGILNLAFGDETVHVKVELDQGSVTAARAAIEGAFQDETVTVKVKVDTSSLSAATRKIAGFNKTLNNALNIDTSKWMAKVDEVIGALDDLGDATQELLADQKDLGAHMREVRGEMSMMANAASALDLNLDGAFNRFDDLQRIDLSHITGQLRGLNQDLRDIDWSKLGQDIQGFAAGVQQAFNIDTSEWKEQVKEAKDVLHELHIETQDTEGAAHRLGEAMHRQRDEIDDARWQDMLESLTRIEGKFDDLGKKIGQATSVTRSFATTTQDFLGKTEAQFTAMERAHGRVAAAARDLADAEGEVRARADELEAAHSRVASTMNIVDFRLNEMKRAQEEVNFLQAMGESTADELGDAHNRLSTALAQYNAALENQQRAQADLHRVEAQRSISLADVRNKTDELTRAQGALGQAGKDVEVGQNRAARSFDNTSGSGMRLYQVLRNLKTAFIGLSVVGLIVPGIGVLGGAVLGLAAAMSDLLPVALLLPAALTGIGVAAAGMFAIFKNNRYIEESVKQLQEAWKGVGVAIQVFTAPALNRLILALKDLSPIALDLADDFANSFNKIADSFTDYLTNPLYGFRDDLKTILQGGIVQFENFGFAIRAVFEGFINLAAAGQDMMIRVSGSLRRGAEDFRDWVEQARKSGELTRMFERMADVFEQTVQIVKNLVIGFKNLFQISDAARFTQTVMDTLEGITADFRRFTETNQAALTAMFENLGKQVALLRPLMADVADGIRIILTNVDLTPLVDGLRLIMRNFAEGAAEAANAIGRLVREAAPAVNELITLIRNVIPPVEAIATAFLRGVLPVIQAIRPGVERIGEALAYIADKVMPILSGLFTNLGHIISGIVTILAPVVETIASIVGLLPDMSGGFGMVLSAVLGLAVARTIFGRMRDAINGTTQPTSRLGKALQGVGNYARTASTAVGVAMIDMREAFNQGSEAGRRFGQNVQEGATRGATALTGTLNRSLDSASERVQNMGSVAGGVARGVGTAFQGMARGVGGALDATNRSVEGTAAAVGNLPQGFKVAGREAVQAVGQMRDGVNTGLDAVNAGVVRTSEAIARFPQMVGTAFNAAKNAIGTAISGIGRGLDGLGQSVMNVGNRVGEGINNASVSVGRGYDRMRGYFSQFSTFGEFARSAFGTVANTAKSMADSVQQTVGNQVRREIEGTRTVIGTLPGVMNTAGGAFRTFAGAASGAVSGGINVFRSGLSSIMELMGGPWGIALAGAAVAIGMYQEASQKAAQEQQQLRNVLEQSSGVIDEQTIKFEEARLQTEYLAAGADELGVSQYELARATAEGGQAYDDYIRRLEEASAGSADFSPILNQMGASFGITKEQLRVLVDTMKEHRAQILAQQEAVRQANEAETRRQTSMSASQRATEDMTKALADLNQAQGDVEKSSDALSRAMDAASGRSRDAGEAQHDYGEALRDAQQAASQYAGQVTILNGQIDQNTEAGGRAYETMDQLRDSTLQNAQAAFQAAGGTSNLAAATDAAKRAMQNGRQAMIDTLTQLTGNRRAAEEYVGQLMSIPDDILTRIMADPSRAQQIIDDWRRGVNTMPPENTQLHVGADTMRAMEDVRGAGQVINHGDPNDTQIPTGANTDQAGQDVDQRRDDIEGEDAVGLPVGANLTLFRDELGDERMRIEAPDAKWSIPLAANFDQFRIDLGNERMRIGDIVSAAWEIPLKANFTQFQDDLTAMQGRVEASAGAWAKAITAKFDDFNQQMAAKREEVLRDRSWVIPIGANFEAFRLDYEQWLNRVTTDQRWQIHMVAPDWTLFNDSYEQRLRDVLGDLRWKIFLHADFSIFDQELQTRIDALAADARWKVFIHADFTLFDQEMKDKMNAITNGASWRIPMGINWDRDFTPAFQAKYNEIVNGAAWPIPMGVNSQQFDQWVKIAQDYIRNPQNWIIPVQGDFSPFINKLLQIIDILQQGIVIPVYLAFGGFAGGMGGGAAAGGGGGGGGGMRYVAEGDIIEAQAQAAVKTAKKFAAGGFEPAMKKRDHMAMKAAMGDAIKTYATGGTNMLAEAGLTPMAAGRAQVVPPNSWRVIGDRTQDDEAYIPINQSARSMAIFEQTAKRMGYAVQKMAEGGFNPTSTVTNNNPRSTESSGNQQVINNSNEAPMVAGDLVITVPSETPVQDSMDEVLFQLRRIKRGGVHVRSALRSR